MVTKPSSTSAAGSLAHSPVLAHVREAGLILAGTLALTLIGQISIPLPFTPVPISMGTFAALGVGAVLGSRRGALSALLLGALAAVGASGRQPEEVLVVPVPADPGRARERGIDHTASLARAVARWTGMRYRPVLVRSRSAPDQVGLDSGRRRSAQTGTMTLGRRGARRALPPGAAVVVLDDDDVVASSETRRLLRRFERSSNILAVRSTSPSPDSDLTAAARIRNAALIRFARDGFDAGLRAIATDAGVTAGLNTHHFGSKDGLRRACDTEVLRLTVEVKSASTYFGGPVDLMTQMSQVEEYIPATAYAMRSIVAGGELATELKFGVTGVRA